MLKRHQVLLTDWQTEYARFISETYDISFSEAVRALMATGIIRTVKQIHPEFESKANVKEVVDATLMGSDKRMRTELLHKFLSLLYFDARKAVEFRLSQARKKARK